MGRIKNDKNLTKKEKISAYIFQLYLLAEQTVETEEEFAMLNSIVADLSELLDIDEEEQACRVA